MSAQEHVPSKVIANYYSYFFFTSDICNKIMTPNTCPKTVKQLFKKGKRKEDKLKLMACSPQIEPDRASLRAKRSV